MQCCSNINFVGNRNLLIWGRRSWYWTMLCPHQREPPGVRYFHFRIPSYILYMWCCIYLNLIWLVSDHIHMVLMCPAVVNRSRWNMCECGLHSQETDAPDGLAQHGNAGRAQVWLGVWRDRWALRAATQKGTEGGTSEQLPVVNQRQASSVVTCCLSSDSTDGHLSTQWNTTGTRWRRRWTTTSAHWTGATGWHWETRMSTMSMPTQSSLNHTKSR